MIFVTVGTHEQQFNRLIEAIDALKGQGIIKEEVVMQTGFCTYEPRHCEWHRLIPYTQMQENIGNAGIVITHGGPASFLMPLQVGKIPVVVPRQKRYGEHVNDHQLEFCRAVEERMGNIIVVEDVGRLSDVISKYEEYCRERKRAMASHNQAFNEQLEDIVRDLGV